MKRAIVVGIALSLACHIAHATDDQAAADLLISKGLELRRQGKALDAIDLFQKALAMAPAPRTFGQLGLAEADVERWSEAEEDLQAALTAPRDAWVRRNHQVLDQAIDLVRAHIGQIALTGTVGAAISVSGRAIGKLPLAKPIRANAGPALITATAPGYRPFEMSVPVDVGKETQLRIVLEPIEPPRPPPVVTPSPPGALIREPQPPQQHPDKESAWRTWTGASLIAGGGGLLVWGIVWIAIDGKNAGGSCSAGSSPGCVPVYTTRTTGIVLSGVGAAATIAGGVLLYTGRTHNAELGVAAGPSSLTLAGRF